MKHIFLAAVSCCIFLANINASGTLPADRDTATSANP
jgi:hypothetical protein